QAEIATFKVVIDDNQGVLGFTTGFSGLRGTQKNRLFVKITKLDGAAKTAPADYEFNAYYIPMVQTSDVQGGASHYTLPTTGLPNLMITSKLSGCTFGVGSDANGSKLVSHVQPDSTIADQAQRGTDLATNVRAGFTTMKGRFRKGH